MIRGCITNPRKIDKIQPTTIYDVDQSALLELKRCDFKIRIEFWKDSAQLCSIMVIVVGAFLW